MRTVSSVTASTVRTRVRGDHRAGGDGVGGDGVGVGGVGVGGGAGGAYRASGDGVGGNQHRRGRREMDYAGSRTPAKTVVGASRKASGRCRTPSGDDGESRVSRVARSSAGRDSLIDSRSRVRKACR